MKFHCDENEVTKFANLKEESTKCSFKGENIFVSSKNCLSGIDKENWDLEVGILICKAKIKKLRHLPANLRTRGLLKN